MDHYPTDPYGGHEPGCACSRCFDVAADRQWEDNQAADYAEAMARDYAEAMAELEGATVTASCLCSEIDPSDRPCLVCDALAYLDTLTPPSPSPSAGTHDPDSTRGDGEDSKADGASPFQQQEQE